MTASFTRRAVLRAGAALAALGGGTGAYAVGIEPMSGPRVTRYRVEPLGDWPEGLALKVAAVSDLHACDPWMSLARVEGIVARVNALGADLVVLLGDYVAGTRWITGTVPSPAWAAALAGLRAPLGRYAILGNHDWWADEAAQARGTGPCSAGEALEAAGVPVLENASVRLVHRGRAFHLAGLGDQIAFLPSRHRFPGRRIGRDDMAAALAAVPAGEPVILLAHEPDAFPRVPARVALTLSGHTHGGQVRLFGRPLTVPSRYGRRYAYGRVREHGDLIVSGGLGCSILPVRLGMPPEVVMVEIGRGVGA